MKLLIITLAACGLNSGTTAMSQRKSNNDECSYDVHNSQYTGHMRRNASLCFSLRISTQY